MLIIYNLLCYINTHVFFSSTKKSALKFKNLAAAMQRYFTVATPLYRGSATLSWQFHFTVAAPLYRSYATLPWQCHFTVATPRYRGNSTLP